VAGFEPATSCSQSRRDNRATLHPENNCYSLIRHSRQSGRNNWVMVNPKSKKSGETGTRTLATVTRRQISNLLRYHSGTSPIIFTRTYLFCGCKSKISYWILQPFLVFFLSFLIFDLESFKFQHYTRKKSLNKM
jgi:hypothetical protein